MFINELKKEGFQHRVSAAQADNDNQRRFSAISAAISADRLMRDLVPLTDSWRSPREDHERSISRRLVVIAKAAKPRIKEKKAEFAAEILQAEILLKAPQASR